MKSHKGYPKGEPEADCERFKNWWSEELALAGGSGTLSVSYAPFETRESLWSTGKRVLEALGGSRQNLSVHNFSCDLPSIRSEAVIEAPVIWDLQSPICVSRAWQLRGEQYPPLSKNPS